jgi:hypothetical protein
MPLPSMETRFAANTNRSDFFCKIERISYFKRRAEVRANETWPPDSVLASCAYSEIRFCAQAGGIP